MWLGYKRVMRMIIRSLGRNVGTTTLLVALAQTGILSAQTPVAPAAKPARPVPAAPASVAASGEDGLNLAGNGHCPEALPLLRRALPRTTGKDLRKRVSIALANCANQLDLIDEATGTLRNLNRELPNDPDVLLLSVHMYSDLSTRAGRALMRTSPGSPQVHELNAEALESQGKWDDAAKEYRLVIGRFPSYPGMHFKLGRLLLTKPNPAANFGEAREEFEAELKINPGNAAAECVLGELSRQEAKWPDAIFHFDRAAKLDAGFFDAYLGLGRTLISANRPADAIAPLERAVKLQAGNPMAHLQLGNAYQQAGRKEDAAREFAALKQTSERIRQMTDEVKAGIDGVKIGEPQRQP